MNDLTPIAIMLVVAAIALGLGATIAAQQAETTCESGDGSYNATTDKCYTNSTHIVEQMNYASNSTRYGMEGLNTFGSYVPTIALVAVVSIVLGILIFYLAKRFA